MTREAQTILLFPKLVGKRIRIFTQIPNSHWATAEVTGHEAHHLLIKNIEIWNGIKQNKKRISASHITKIEIL